ncbi:hypothetical protein FA15DRAFT_661221 [Coprinopsis marcescibilis]|uniref:Uncharacterized protein n=1 Tax=Coprinopsis marcescibilis TaxID=230819 RepID=A0A5C3KCE4_COPMA|nr:hypothetical protein FA15DRAFT_661221 [Coprinopsis marcescibilis]
MSITTVLVSWEAVGSAEVACSLLACAIETYRVAQAVCFRHQRHLDKTKFVSLTYLSLLVMRLWELVGSIQTVAAATGNGLTVGQPNSEPDRLEASVLEDLIAAIRANGPVPNDTEINGFITLRRKGKKALSSSVS